MDDSADWLEDPVNLANLIEGNEESYLNVIAALVNDHVMRISVMTEAYFWHRHPNSDETFIGIQGQLVVETPEKEFILSVGDVLTVPRGTAHRTRPLGERSVNLTVEKLDIATVRL